MRLFFVGGGGREGAVGLESDLDGIKGGEGSGRWGRLDKGHGIMTRIRGGQCRHFQFDLGGSAKLEADQRM